MNVGSESEAAIVVDLRFAPYELNPMPLCRMLTFVSWGDRDLG